MKPLYPLNPLIVGIEIRMAFQCMSLAGTMYVSKSYSSEKVMSTNACSLCDTSALNSPRLKRNNGTQKSAVIVNHAAESLTKSRCISSNGISTPLKERSTTPTSIRPIISECTALKS